MSYTFERIAPKARDKGETSTAAHIEEGGGMDGPDASLGRLERNQERWMGRREQPHVKWGPGRSVADGDGMAM
ncbi:hypothetical protein MRB53_003440 [Persea americana]|uniref:Uncharacterized protein n=1 Tax=Persea americana TaxID=3435 RepID=A0ACC2MZQ1_PERAE|nr:hypothetical protein MRB53_003440 [Persea americana]